MVAMFQKSAQSQSRAEKYGLFSLDHRMQASQYDVVVDPVRIVLEDCML
jgi:hypothetical protein